MAIGQKLEDARNRKGISIREASESTKIRGDFLNSFEAGNFDINLPEVYLRGFIRVYARFLGIDPESAVADLNLEIGSVKNKSVKKTIGKIGSPESSDSPKEMSVVDNHRLPTQRGSNVNISKPILFVGGISTIVIVFAILLIWAFSTPDEQTDVSNAVDLDQTNTVRETNLKTSNISTPLIEQENALKVLEESLLRLAAVGPIERLIISDEGKSPKVFHEFKNISLGWEKSIPFSKSFRCYSSSLQNIRFAVDDGIEKQVNGEGAGNFSWSGE
jgi:cytoskeleton protein RodZ